MESRIWWTCAFANDYPGHHELEIGVGMMDVNTVTDTSIPRQSLTSAVADRLRDQIIRGDIPEGAQLRQNVIAEQYQVSRIPVREALRQLDAEGLITIVPNRGAVVPELLPDDIEELFAIRALLEPAVLEISIPRLTDALLGKADAVLSKFETDLRKEEHIGNWGRLNWQFHSILYSGANRPHFMSIIRNVNHRGGALHPLATLFDPWNEAGQRRAPPHPGIVPAARGQGRL